MPIDPLNPDKAKDAGGGWLSAALPALIAGASAVTRGGPKRQYKYNKKLAEDQNAMNRANAEWILQQNKQLSEEQRAYDSPEAQMARYKAAGLNPNLIYGQGSSGNMGSPVTVGGMPGANMGSVDASYPDVASSFVGATQAMAGLDLTRAKTNESQIRQQSIQIQNEIAKNNPMLDPEVARSVSEGMIAVSQTKREEYLANWSDSGKDGYTQNGRRKIEAEVAAMEQKLGLNTSDLKIKNKILESKEYQNAISELQMKWLKDGDFNAEHIRQGLMLLLSKMLK